MAEALALAPQSRVAAAVRFRTQRALFLFAAPAFFVAWASPLFVPTSMSHFCSFCRTFFSRRISSSLFLVSASGCDVAWFSALEISLVSEWTRRLSRFLRIDRFVFLH